MKRLFVLAALVAAALASGATHASALTQLVANDDKACLIKITAPDTAGRRRFGARVALSGDTLVTTADSMGRGMGKAVYVFLRSDKGWSEQQKIMLDVEPLSVAIKGDTLAVGFDGRVEVWVRIDGVWSLQSRMTDIDSGVVTSLAIDGDTLAVGAPFPGDYYAFPVGAVYVYVRTGTTWVREQAIGAPVRQANGYFGNSVAIEGDLLAIGAPYENSSGVAAAGSAYVYRRVGNEWSQESTLAAPDPEWSGVFGSSVALDGQQLAVGANGWSSETGAIYIWNHDGASWTLGQRIVAPDGSPGVYGDVHGHNFGVTIALAGDTLVAGAPEDGDNGFQSGSVYVLRRVDGWWVFQRKILAPDRIANLFFGTELAVDSGRAVVATPGDDTLLGYGRVYAFDLGFVTPVETTVTVPTQGILANDAVAVAGLISVMPRSQPAHGVLATRVGGGFSYRPARAWKGSDSFKYAFAAAALTSNAAAVTVQTWQPTGLTLASGDLTPKYAHATVLRATFKTVAGKALAGQLVRFEALHGVRWESVGSATTDSHGVASLRVASVTTGRSYRARTSFSATYGAAGSDQIRVVPHVSLATPVTPVSVARSRAFTVSGTLKPHHKAGTKPLQLRFYHLESGVWVFIQSLSVAVKDHTGYSQYSVRASLALSGRWQVRAYHPGDTAGASTWSGMRYLTVR